MDPELQKPLYLFFLGYLFKTSINPPGSTTIVSHFCGRAEPAEGNVGERKALIDQGGRNGAAVVGEWGRAGPPQRKRGAARSGF
jgi:hypothetical protein